MCGIVGEYLFNQNYSNHNIEILLEKVIKRGPDFSDIYTSDCNGYNISCFGGSDGFIQINSLPPLCTVQWDDGTVGLYNGNLSAGVHGATIEDDQGCNYLFFDTLTEPPPITSPFNFVNCLVIFSPYF